VLQVIASVSARRGGPTTSINNLTSALQLRGIEVDIATTDDDGPGRHLTLERSNLVKTAGQRVIYFRKQTDFYSTSLPMLIWLFQNGRRYDVIHVHGLFNFAPVAAALSAVMSRRPFVLTPHGTLDTWGLANRRPTFKRLSIRLLESHIINASTIIHFASDIERLQAQKLGFLTEAVVIPFGMDLSQLTATTKLTRPLNWPEELGVKPTVLFLSRIDRVKGLDVLIDAFFSVLREAPTALLAIAGDGDPRLVEILKRRARQLGIEDSVHWLGFVSAKNKCWLLSNSSVFVLPSQSENFGFAVVEAMASGLPVIVSPGVGIADLVQRCGAGSVCTSSSEELSSIIVSWLRDPAKCKQAGAAGRQLALDEMSLETCGRRFEDLYRAIIANNSRTKQ
jgi:glycosyltransferase involved in cell wall biosynthesis